MKGWWKLTQQYFSKETSSHKVASFLKEHMFGAGCCLFSPGVCLKSEICWRAFSQRHNLPLKCKNHMSASFHLMNE